MRKHAIGLMLAVGALLPVPAPAQDEEASLAYPNVAFTFAAAYVAEDAGLFAKHGLRLKPLVVAGPGSTNAVISGDRKSTRLNSSHMSISYAVFCLKKKTGTCRRCRRLLDEQEKPRTAQVCHHS